MSDRSLGHLLRRRAAEAGEKELFRFGTGSVTVAEVERLTNRLANVLTARGVRRGDRVAVMLPNGIAFPVAWLAIAKVGAVIVPINPSYGSADLAHVMRDSGAVLAIGDAAEVFQDETVSDHFDLPDLDRDDLLNLQYTSGTTGLPKGCMLTHGYWLDLAELSGEAAAVREDDVDLTVQPFYYMDPQWNTVLCLQKGIPLVIAERFSASGFWPLVREHGVTFFYVLGTMPLLLLKQPPDPVADRDHKVRLVLCSGITPSLHAAIEERWGAPWREAYGSTEMGAITTADPGDLACVGTGGMGTPVRGKEVKVVGEDGLPVPDGEVGEIVVRGRPSMLGYWGAAASPFDDGWYRMGDLGFRDERGHLHLTGRIKDVIRRGSENIAAAEVESVLAEHPAVRSAAVVAVPDDLLGEEVKAVVQVTEPVEASELAAFVRERLAPFKVPRFVEFVDEFPMTPSERIAKHLLSTSREGACDLRSPDYRNG
ncbi:AMP-binding protein [Nonomuraea sp. NPDC050556]|uniref:AMP-binding protein n=1 Tax=Nonomuraea sp. NPDC050556 TaxID=3364369 RepID=UPI0037A81988